MKKILLIITLSLLTSSNLFAENFNQFNQWLLKNGHSQYLKDGGARVDLCATFKKNSDAWLNEEWANSKIVLTPHSAFYSPTGLIFLREKALKTCIDHLQGVKTSNCINKEYLN